MRRIIRKYICKWSIHVILFLLQRIAIGSVILIHLIFYPIEAGRTRLDENMIVRKEKLSGEHVYDKLERMPEFSGWRTGIASLFSGADKCICLIT